MSKVFKKHPPGWYAFKALFSVLELGCLWLMLLILGVPASVEWWRVIVFALLLGMYTIIDRAESDTLEEFKEE